MSRIFFLIIVSALYLAVISCDDQVEPKTDLNEVYLLNCVIRCDTSYQVATITRSYDVNGYDPNTNMNDPFIDGTKITLTYDSPYGVQVYQLRDTSVARPENSRYTTPLHYYYIKNFQPLYKRNIKIEAILPNGKKLLSTAKSIIVSPYSIQYYLQKNPVPISAELVGFDWYIIKNELKNDNVYFLPEFLISYSKFENGEWKKYQKVIPRKNLGIPIYPFVQQTAGIAYDTLTIRKTLEDISIGDANKQNYQIESIVFMVHILDLNFATYYAVHQTFNTEFSIRVNQPDFTNINNGFGVFGMMYTIKMNVPLRFMILSLGYQIK